MNIQFNDPPAWLFADVICISKAICWRSDIGVLAEMRPIPLELPVTLGRDVDGIFLLTFWNMMTEKNPCNFIVLANQNTELTIAHSTIKSSLFSFYRLRLILLFLKSFFLLNIFFF